jgi:hypothetical protein
MPGLGLDAALVGGVIALLLGLIPACTNQNPCAHSRRPMVMILDGRSMRRFHASQARVTMSS